ncbi:hypothetical protein [Microbacterium sp.]|uniref:hypothetical protein n=1 Tax=Microbacterium sp. TaxID=51671 RepID=UPI00281226D1|nr:hypothetical protein [Microbacterium sp.]
MATWYNITTDDEQARLLAAWDDAPIENLETLGFILGVARDQVTAYAPATTAPIYEPVTLNWATGERVELSRVGQIVTAVVYPRQAATRMNPEGLPLPDAFGITGGDAIIIINPDDDSPQWQLQVVFSGENKYVMLWGALNTVGPYSPNPALFQWVADPAPGDGVPDNYVYAQLQQAKNLWNAGRVNSGGELGVDGYSFTPRPMDKTIKGIIRPTDGKPHAL